MFVLVACMLPGMGMWHVYVFESFMQQLKCVCMCVCVQKFFEDHNPTQRDKAQYKSAIW